MPYHRLRPQPNKKSKPPLLRLKRPDKEELICAFSIVEPCKTITVKPNREPKRLEVASRITKCNHYYLYYNDTEFGWIYYWCSEQCEFATDINFKDREELSRFYKTLVKTVYFTFSSEDVYSFFGRNAEKIHRKQPPD